MPTKLSLVSLLLVSATSVGATPDTLFLTWERDPTSTVAIQWIAPGAELPTPEGAVTAPSPRDEVVLPKLASSLEIDGDLGDWPEHAHRVKLFANPGGGVAAPKDFSAELLLGWTDQGLAVAAVVSDDVTVGTPNPNNPWSGDSMEIFVGPPGGGHTQVILGVEDQVHLVVDRRTERPTAPIVHHARVVDSRGRQVFEALIPWESIGGPATEGDEVRLQVVFNDLDPRRPIRTYAWFPLSGAHENPEAYHRVRLGQTSNRGAEDLVAYFATPHGEILNVSAVAERASETVTVFAGERKLAVGVLQKSEAGLARAELRLPPPPAGRHWGDLLLRASARPDERLVLPTPRPARLTDPAPVTLSWWAEGEAETTARQATSETVPFGASGDYVHRVRLEGLRPDARFRFRVGDSERTESFLTAPATLDRPLVFAQGGDIGTRPVVRDLHRVAASWSPRFAVVGGDLAYADGVHVDRWWHYLRDWHAFMRTPEGDLIPKLVCIGNHEVRGGYDGTRERAPFYYALFDGLYPETGYAVLDFGSWLSLFLLDTQHTTPVAGEQTRWFAGALAERREIPHRIVVYHVPAWPSHRPFEERVSALVREHWVPLLEQERPSIVFEHHDHTYKRTKRLRGGKPHPEGVLYVGDGNWGRGSRSVHPERPYLERAESALNVLRVTLHTDGTGEGRAFDETGRELDSFRFSGNR